MYITREYTAKRRMAMTQGVLRQVGEGKERETKNLFLGGFTVSVITVGVISCGCEVGISF